MKPENTEVKERIEAFFRALDTGDFGLMKSLIPEDGAMIHIGTDEGEIWKGRDSLMSATEEQFQKLEYYKATMRDLTINLSRSGECAWYYHLLDARIKSGGDEEIWQGARFTGVLEKRDGDWMLVQTHVSLPESIQS